MSGSANYRCSRRPRRTLLDDLTPAQQSGFAYAIQQRATVEIVMTENSKTPPAKKTIEDPPEYGAAAGEKSNSWTGRGKPPEQPSGETEAGYQQNGQTAVAPTGTGDQAKKTAGTKDWLGGPQKRSRSAWLQGEWSDRLGESAGRRSKKPPNGRRICKEPTNGRVAADNAATSPPYAIMGASGTDRVFSR